MPQPLGMYPSLELEALAILALESLVLGFDFTRHLGVEGPKDIIGHGNGEIDARIVELFKTVQLSVRQVCSAHVVLVIGHSSNQRPEAVRQRRYIPERPVDDLGCAFQLRRVIANEFLHRGIDAPADRQSGGVAADNVDVVGRIGKVKRALQLLGDFAPDEHLRESLHKEHQRQVKRKMQRDPDVATQRGQVRLCAEPVKIDEKDKVDGGDGGGDEANGGGVPGVLVLDNDEHLFGERLSALAENHDGQQRQALHQMRLADAQHGRVVGQQQADDALGGRHAVPGDKGAAAAALVEAEREAEVDGAGGGVNGHLGEQW
ncbi:hypothetical protein HC256_001037 [Beauveria bassiana]|nr:hypothetical protein HC256_001037 [Beauveria bassiana]